jgi:hypothetical protein
MKKSNKTAVITTAIISSVVVGATISWFLFPERRKKVVSSLNSGTASISDSIKVKLYSFMENLKKELERACDKANNYLQMEKALNGKILKITLKIQSDFPELYNYIDEMSITIPDSNDPEISLSNLNKYYNSLEVMLNNYKPTHKKNINPS